MYYYAFSNSTEPPCCLILHKEECYLTPHWGQQVKVWREGTPFQIINIIILFYTGFLCNYNAMVWIDINNRAMKMLRRDPGGNRSSSVLAIKCNICYLKQPRAAQSNGPVCSYSLPSREEGVLPETEALCKEHKQTYYKGKTVFL